MMRHAITCFVVLTTATRLAAQDSARMHGTVVYRLTGRPVEGAHLGVFPGGPARWTLSDSLGQFTISPVAPGTRELLMECPRPSGRWADTIRATVRPGQQLEFHLTVETAYCSNPPAEERTGVWTGLYETGFEAFGFLPDPDSTGHPVLWWRWPAATVTFLPSAGVREFAWPEARTPHSYSCYAVRWHGTLYGIRVPDGVVWIGGGPDELRVDSILSITPAAPRHCPSG